MTSLLLIAPFHIVNTCINIEKYPAKSIVSVGLQVRVDCVDLKSRCQRPCEEEPPSSCPATTTSRAPSSTPSSGTRAIRNSSATCRRRRHRPGCTTSMEFLSTWVAILRLLIYARRRKKSFNNGEIGACLSEGGWVERVFSGERRRFAKLTARARERDISKQSER